MMKSVLNQSPLVGKLFKDSICIVSKARASKNFYCHKNCLLSINTQLFFQLSGKIKTPSK